MNLRKDCPFWSDDSKCAMRSCHVSTCEEKDIPEGLKGAHLQEEFVYKVNWTTIHSLEIAFIGNRREIGVFIRIDMDSTRNKDLTIGNITGACKNSIFNGATRFDIAICIGRTTEIRSAVAEQIQMRS